MTSSNDKILNRFHMMGISYLNSDAETRGRFAIDEKSYKKILSENYPDIDEFIILSTCNRTEIYAFCDFPGQLAEILCQYPKNEVEEFMKISTSLQGVEAVEHLFSVVSGLSSQLLGDYEISGQFRKAAKMAKEFGHVGACMERMANTALQVSKNIKNQTKLSDGTVSVSFATIQYLKNNFDTIQGKKILVVGLGKIGTNTCKNLIDYSGADDLTVCNRSINTATEFAATHQLKILPYEQLKAKAKSFDIVIFATGAQEAILNKNDLSVSSDITLIDLSIPSNVNTNVEDLPDVKLVNVDMISLLKDDTLQKRQQEVPKAKMILHNHLEEFKEWADHRQFAGNLKSLKYSLQSFAEAHQQIQVNQIIRQAAQKLKTRKYSGCEHLRAINQIIQQDLKSF